MKNQWILLLKGQLVEEENHGRGGKITSLLDNEAVVA